MREGTNTASPTYFQSAPETTLLLLAIKCLPCASNETLFESFFLVAAGNRESSSAVAVILSPFVSTHKWSTSEQKEKEHLISSDATFLRFVRSKDHVVVSFPSQFR